MTDNIVRTLRLLERAPAVPTITFREARAAGAYAASYRMMARHVGGVTRYGADTPLPIVTVLDVLAVHLDKAGFEIGAYLGEHPVQEVQVLSGEHPAPVLGHEDQMNMER